jgi:hypothetical protein
VRRIQKTLEEANIKLGSVLSDVMGRSAGMRTRAVALRVELLRKGRVTSDLIVAAWYATDR